MNSCIYVGSVRHRRLSPVPHAFRYRLFMMYLDLAELPGLFDGRWLWSARRFAPAWFRRADYLGDRSEPLDDAVRALVAERTGDRPDGPIRLLTHLRYLGYCLNPVSFYYCFDDAGETVESVVAEITNTPWNERHVYVLDHDPVRRRFDFAKEFHISPFMEMDHEYRWRLRAPGERLAVHMENYRGGAKVFDATLAMQRRPISSGALARTLLGHPFMTGKVVAGIYWQALRLWWKRCPFHAHPARRAS